MIIRMNGAKRLNVFSLDKLVMVFHKQGHLRSDYKSRRSILVVVVVFVVVIVIVFVVGLVGEEEVVVV